MEPDLVPYQAVPYPPARRVLALAPHPDDEVIGCGGTLAALVAAGVPVHVVIASGGELGTDDARAASGLPEARRAEACAAAAVLGYPEPEFWGLPDRGLRFGEPLVDRVLQAIRAHDADLVLAPSMYEVHPDHRALAFAALEAVRRAGAPLAIALYEVGAAVQPNLLVDITPQLERKAEAMRCFASQLAVAPYHEYVQGLNRWRAYTLGPAVQAAEAMMLLEAARLDAPHWPLLEPEWARQLRSDPFGAVAGETAAPLGASMRLSLVVPAGLLAAGSATAESLALQTWPAAEIVPIGAPELQRCGAIPLRMAWVVGREAPAEDLAAALARCEGDAVLVIDRPVVLKPDALSKLAGALAASPGAQAAVAHAVCVDRDGRVHDNRVDRAHEQPPGGAHPLATVLLRRAGLAPRLAGAVPLDFEALRGHVAGLDEIVSVDTHITVAAEPAQPADGADRLRVELAAAHAEVARMMGSRSWRITRPLRALADWARGLRGRHSGD